MLTNAMKHWALCIFICMAGTAFGADASLPDGKGKDVVVNACSSCHSLDRITALRLSEEGWRNTLRQMTENGASLNPEDINPILAYLVANFGAPATGNAAAAVPAPATIPAPVAKEKAAVASVAAGDSSRVSFNRDIRPIMSGTCFRCHGPDVSSRMAGMRLDIREEALKPKAHGTPIVPGDPANSEVVQRIFASDGRIMPPAYANKELTAEQKDTIRRWIAEGAKYEGHWAYQPITRPNVPAVGGSKVLNPIDAFIQARLEKEGLKPSEEADRRILIRRVTLDLTGLAPEPAQVEAFLRDRSPDAFEKVVDRLLDSQAYAEHESVGWLDAVRYADTAGYHSDGDRPAWPYRDYVLKAFRENKPFDQFTREQLAGDLMPNATTEQKIASAYNRMGRTSAEGGLQPKEYFAKYGADRVRALGANWLGSTLGCAECHDHKFDPVLTKDFYALKAFFADVKEDGLVQDVGPDAFSPKMPVYKPGEKERIDNLVRQIAAAKTDLSAKADNLVEQRRKWERETLEQAKSGEKAWTFPMPVAASAHTAKLTIEPNGPTAAEIAASSALRGGSPGGPGMIVVSGPNPDNETYTVELKPGPGLWASVGIEVDSDLSLAGANVSRGSDRFIVTEVDAKYSADGRQALKPAPFVLAYSATTPTTGYPALAAIDGDSATGWGFFGGAGKPFLILRFAEPLRTGSDSTLVVRLHQDSKYRRATLGRFRIALSSGTPLWPDPPITDAPNTTAPNAAAPNTAAPNAVALKAVTPNAATPNAVVPNAAAPNAVVPNAATPNAVTPNAVTPNTVAPNAATPNAATPSATAPKPPSGGFPAPLRQALELAEDKRTPEQAGVIRDYFEYSSPDLLAARLAIAKLEMNLSILQSAVAQVMVTESVEPRETRILPRGDWMSDAGAIVQPAIPEFLGKLDTGGRRATRLDLANWLVSSNNPLTARVFVNRLWRQFFGTGLSRILEDVGSQGEWPSHPELLDWLASEFMNPAAAGAAAHPWDVRHMIRTIVTSYTYRQTSVSTPELDQRDPDNRLLARQSRFRVDAEVVHDLALQISGLLVNKFGGPPVRPYQPDGYLAALNFPKRDWSASRGEDLYRRAIYTHWQRTFLHPMLGNFDAPSREESNVNRINSNTPLQALDLLNDPIFVEAARAFAERILREGGSHLQSQMEWAFQEATGRRPDNDELKILTDLHAESLAHFKEAPADAHELLKVGDSPVPSKMNPAELAAMSNVARTILNLHEVITRD
jgi:cytochrome c553